MSLREIIQAFGWIPVCGLLTVHVLIYLGRLPRHGTAIRVAGYVAALTIVAAAVSTRMWPIAVLGLLFMRTELLGHRHHEERTAHQGAQRIPAARRAPGDGGDKEVLDDVRIHHGSDVIGVAHSRHPEYTVPGMTAASATTLRARTHAKNDPEFVPASVGLREGHHEHEAQPEPAGTMRFLMSAKHFTDVLLKLEIIAVVVIALVLFGVWAEGQRRDFTRNSDSNVCQMSYSC
jgi:hypothetical protein